MLKSGTDIGLPETHRIVLALSIAFLVHTLLVATFPFDLPEHRHNPITVEVQLTPQGSLPSRERSASRASAEPIATPFAIEDPEPESSSPDVVTTNTTKLDSAPEPTSSPLTSPSASNNARPQPQSDTSASLNALASTLSAAGNEREMTQPDEPAPVTQKSQVPSEEASYRSKLTKNISEKGGVSKKQMLNPAIQADLKEKKLLTVGLRLRLLENGTLIDAKVEKPSGNNELDLVMYRAALAASPYPEPPDPLKGQRWFSVELKAQDF